MSYYEDATFATRRVFPVCPVELPSGYFYTFSKADLARDNVRRKPDYGAVVPAVMGLSDNSYTCHVDQIIIGLDKIVVLPYQRTNSTEEFNMKLGQIEFENFNDLTAMPQDAASAWAKVSELTGATFKPILYVGRQIVDGINHWFIAEETRITLGGERQLVMFAVNENSGGFELVPESFLILA